MRVCRLLFALPRRRSATPSTHPYASSSWRTKIWTSSGRWWRDGWQLLQLQRPSPLSWSHQMTRMDEMPSTVAAVPGPALRKAFSAEPPPPADSPNCSCAQSRLSRTSRLLCRRSWRKRCSPGGWSWACDQPAGPNCREESIRIMITRVHLSKVTFLE